MSFISVARQPFHLSIHLPDQQIVPEFQMQCLRITIGSVMQRNVKILVKGIIAGYCYIVLPDTVPKVKMLECNRPLCNLLS